VTARAIASLTVAAQQLFSFGPHRAIVVHRDRVGAARLLIDQVGGAVAVKIGDGRDTPPGVAGLMQPAPVFVRCYLILARPAHFGQLDISRNVDEFVLAAEKAVGQMLRDLRSEVSFVRFPVRSSDFSQNGRPRRLGGVVLPRPFCALAGKICTAPAGITPEIAITSAPKFRRRRWLERSRPPRVLPATITMPAPLVQ